MITTFQLLIVHYILIVYIILFTSNCPTRYDLYKEIFSATFSAMGAISCMSSLDFSLEQSAATPSPTSSNLADGSKDFTKLSTCCGIDRANRCIYAISLSGISRRRTTSGRGSTPAFQASNRSTTGSATSVSSLRDFFSASFEFLSDYIQVTRSTSPSWWRVNSRSSSMYSTLSSSTAWSRSWTDSS